MSYCRFGHDRSDVYVFHSVYGYLDCCGCILQEAELVEHPEALLGFYLKPQGELILTHFTSRQELIEHLDRHRAAGHLVPQHVYERLRAEIAQEGDKVT